MPDMRGVAAAAPSNKRTAAAKPQQEEDDGGWGDTAALLDWSSVSYMMCVREI